VAFLPDKDRLPFIDIHQSGTRRDRDLYAYCFANDEAWKELMRERRFDIALLDGHQEWTLGDQSIDRLDVDSSWALVFRDDAAAVFVRRDGALAAKAESLAYRVMPGGIAKFTSLAGAAQRDTLLRRVLRAELERCARSSPLDAWANTYLASLDFLDRDADAARRHLNAALAVDPRTPGAHRRLGYLDLIAGSYRSAITEFDRERALGGPIEDEYQQMGEAWKSSATDARPWPPIAARSKAHPFNEAARASLERLQ
jgi:tetratricopeptide (TPR) repeat protein